MKEYTAIYSTEKMNNIQYSFKAEDTSSAVVFMSKHLGAFPQIVLVENTEPLGKANEGKVVWVNGNEVL